MATFPNGVKIWTDVADNTDYILDHHINDAYAEIIALETQLLSGVPPLKNWIINGGFDVWQRCAIQILTSAAVFFTADRWRDYVDADSGTLPIISNAKAYDVAGGVPLFCKHTANGAGSAFGVEALHIYAQTIENGTRKLCGAGKKVTLSFWARSNVANKRIGVGLRQNYGSGGSPSAQESLIGFNWTLTSTWTKYTCTFTTNTLTGKTFGTGYDDFLDVIFAFMWGTSTWATFVGASTIETYVGAGDVDIANVCLAPGSVPMDYASEAYGDVLRQCQRYCFKIESSEAIYAKFCTGSAVSTVQANCVLEHPVVMRGVPVLSSFSNLRLSEDVGEFAVTGLISSIYSTRYSSVMQATVAAGLTQYRTYWLGAQNSVAGHILMSAEI